VELCQHQLMALFLMMMMMMMMMMMICVDLLSQLVLSTVSTKPVDIADTLFTSGLAKQIPQTKRNKPTASGSSHTAVAAAAAEEAGLFEDPLMVVTKK